MSLIACAACNVEMSDEAAACPKCGHPNAKIAEKNEKKSGYAVGLVAAALGMIVAIMPIPYFVLVFLVPATLIFGILAFAKRQRLAGVFAILLGVAGIAQIVSVQNQIDAATRQAQAAAEQIQRDAQKAQHEIDPAPRLLEEK
jgi:uncharacterized paraquat-inducible protein A